MSVNPPEQIQASPVSWTAVQDPVWEVLLWSVLESQREWAVSVREVPGTSAAVTVARTNLREAWEPEGCLAMAERNLETLVPVEPPSAVRAAAQVQALPGQEEAAQEQALPEQEEAAQAQVLPGQEEAAQEQALPGQEEAAQAQVLPGQETAHTRDPFLPRPRAGRPRGEIPRPG